MRKALGALIIVLVAWALVVAVTGGFNVRPYGFRLRSTDPGRPAYVALALMALYVFAFRAHARSHLAWLERRLEWAAETASRQGRYIAAVLALAITALGITNGILVAGGSDSYGYISEADLWLAGDLTIEQPIATQVPWPNADETFAPLGYRPAQQRGAIVPVYAAGLPVLMAAAKWLIGTCGPYLVVPILGGLMVWLTYWLGAQIWSSLLGVFSAALMATSPTFLFMLMNPMSDVPVSAFFLAGLVIALSPWSSRAFWTGLAVSMAIFIRPNLVPLGAVFLTLVLARAPAWQRWRAFFWFGLGGLPLMLAIAAINTRLYGAPWHVGYGSLDEFYAWGYIVKNLAQYSTWLLRTETPFIVLALVPLWFVRRLEGERRRAMTFMILLVAAVWLSYVFYFPFDVWWYLRFLLPAFPAMFVLAAIGFVLALRRLVGAERVIGAALLIALPIFALRINTVRQEGIFTLWAGGVLYVSAAEYVRKELPANAVIMTVQHSGSIRYYANRLTFRWDLLPTEWWPLALNILVERGYRPYFLVSVFEEAQLRRTLGFSSAEDGPGTVVARMDYPERIRIYDPLRQSTAPAATIPAVVACPCGVGH